MIRTRLVMMALLLTAVGGCGLLQRSEQATNVEDEAPAPSKGGQPTAVQPPARPPAEATDEDADMERASAEATGPLDPLAGTEPAPQHVGGQDKPVGRARLGEARSLFDRALKEQNDGAFLKAAELWKEFIDRQVGMPGYERASYNYSYCLFSLGQPAGAEERLKALTTSASDPGLVNDARILLAESLIQLKKADEALAITYEVIPNRAGEEAAGLKRDSDAVGTAQDTTRPSLIQKIRLYTIRGRIFATLGQDEHAHDSLEKAKLLLVHSKKGQISSIDIRFLSANYAWRQMEVQALACQHRITVPERLSEAEFLAYAGAYYGCAAPARKLMCTVIAARHEQVKALAVATYRGLVEAPLVLRDHLPPPAREIKKPGTQSYYESELKALIEKTVADRSKDFRHLPSCQPQDVF